MFNMKTTNYKLVDHQFKLFANNVRPKLTTGELQVLAAFVIFQKSGDTKSIPGQTENQTHDERIGSECPMCNSRLGSSVYDDGLMRCLDCGCH